MTDVFMLYSYLLLTKISLNREYSTVHHGDYVSRDQLYATASHMVGILFLARLKHLEFFFLFIYYRIYQFFISLLIIIIYFLCFYNSLIMPDSLSRTCIFFRIFMEKSTY